MGFQGKGILGGFRGKVGSIQGRRVNSKDIIQSNPCYQGGELGFYLDWQPTDMVNPFFATVGNFEITGSTSGFNWDNGAEMPNLMKKAKGGVGCEITSLFNKSFLCISFPGITYSYDVQPYTVYFNGNTYSVRNFGVQVFSPQVMVVGDKFRLEVKSGIVSYQRKIVDGEFVTFYEQPYLVTTATRFNFSLKIGAYNYKSLEQAYKSPRWGD